MATAHDIAAYLIEKTGPLSPWRLHKLIYYCQAWHLVWERRLLFEERIEAWANGPVVPALYPLHKGSFASLTAWPSGSAGTLDAEERESVDAVVSFYKDYGSEDLIWLVTNEPPYREARRGVRPGERGEQEISASSLERYYSSLEEQSEEGYTIQVEEDLPWLPQPNEARWVIGGAMPPPDLTTTAFVFAFKGDKLLMAHVAHSKRGWNPPGGHVEPGEDSLIAAVREAWEEGAVHLRRIRYFGCQELDLKAKRPEGYTYPHPVSYQVFYLAEIDRLGEFAATAEISERQLFAPQEARQLAWISEHLRFYERALELATQEAHRPR
jgi:uncharacterized phage-associated protein/8-oxo-dGTP pyrophosphatase MutT (NUDIX family)